MGEIVKFRFRDRNVRNFQTKAKLNTESRHKLAYRNNPERWRPLDERTRITPVDPTPAIYFVVGAFKAAIRELERKRIIPTGFFTEEDFRWLRYDLYYLPPVLMGVIESLPEHTRAEIILAMCENVHDGWVSDYAGDFFDYFLDWEFVYLPLELIGVDQLSYIYEPMKVELPRFGLGDVSWEMLVRVYDESRTKFLQARRIKRPSDLIDTIVELADQYLPLTPAIREVLRTRELAFDVARQVTHHSAEIFRAKAV